MSGFAVELEDVTRRYVTGPEVVITAGALAHHQCRAILRTLHRLLLSLVNVDQATVARWTPALGKLGSYVSPPSSVCRRVFCYGALDLAVIGAQRSRD